MGGKMKNEKAKRFIRILKTACIRNLQAGAGSLFMTHPISRARMDIVPAPDKTDGARFPGSLESAAKKGFDLVFQLSKESPFSGPLKPVDPAVPDHSLWQEAVLASARVSCGENSQIVSMSLGPVNHFTRYATEYGEYRDASLLFSYLIWVCIRVLCVEFGPEHILYPAVAGTPFFRAWLNGKYTQTGLSEVPPEELAVPLASNSIVAVLPRDSVEAAMKKIRVAIGLEWNGIQGAVWESVRTTASGKASRKEWEIQAHGYLIFNYGVSPWPDRFDEKGDGELEKLFSGIKDCGWDISVPDFLYLKSHQESMDRLSAAKKATPLRKQPGGPDRLCACCGALPCLEGLPGRLCMPCMTRRLVRECTGKFPPLLGLALTSGLAEPVSCADPGGFFAVLSMDGDRMGSLVKGESDQFARYIDLINPAFTNCFHFTEILNAKRRVTPMVHYSLSEALCSFAVKSVPRTVRRYGGILLYAGGDDVVALFPVSTVLIAAQEIRDLYRTAWVLEKTDGSLVACPQGHSFKRGENLLIHPGPAVTMSAAIAVTRNGMPAGKILSLARKILDDEAKDAAGRDALAVAVLEGDRVVRMKSGKWEGSDRTRFIDAMVKEGFLQTDRD
jgi:hypothetical protein